MIKTIRRFATTIAVTVAMVGAPLVIAPAFAYAQTSGTSGTGSNAGGTGTNLNIGNNLNCGSNVDLTDSNTCGVTTGSKNVSTLITTIINVFSLVIGAISIIMIVWGGLQFGFSNGDSGKVKTARETIIYAVVGLVVVGMAQFLVQFVLSKFSGIGS